jgi:hypothetical protein
MQPPSPPRVLQPPVLGSFQLLSRIDSSGSSLNPNQLCTGPFSFYMQVLSDPPDFHGQDLTDINMPIDRRFETISDHQHAHPLRKIPTPDI